MKDINLLPKVARKKNTISIVLNVFIAILIIGILLIAGTIFLLSNSKTSLSKRLDNLEKINLKLKAYDDKLQAYKNFEDNIKYKNDMVKSVKAENIIWSKKFYDITRIIPQGVYLTSFSGSSGNLFDFIEQVKKGAQSQDKKLSAFVIYGYAADYLEVSKFVIGIKNIPEISDPWIVSINESIVNNMKLLSFNIEAYWNLPLFLKDIKIENKNNINTSQNTNINSTNNNQDLNSLLK